MISTRHTRPVPRTRVHVPRTQFLERANGVNFVDLVALRDIVAARPCDIANLECHRAIRVAAQGRSGSSRKDGRRNGIAVGAGRLEFCLAPILVNQDQFAVSLRNEKSVVIFFGAVIADEIPPLSRNVGRLGAGQERGLREQQWSNSTHREKCKND